MTKIINADTIWRKKDECEKTIKMVLCIPFLWDNDRTNYSNVQIMVGDLLSGQIYRRRKSRDFWLVDVHSGFINNINGNTSQFNDLDEGKT